MKNDEKVHAAHVTMKLFRHSTYLLSMPLTGCVNYAAICVKYAILFHNTYFYGILNMGIQKSVLFKKNRQISAFQRRIHKERSKEVIFELYHLIGAYVPLCSGKLSLELEDIHEN